MKEDVKRDNIMKRSNMGYLWPLISNCVAVGITIGIIHSRGWIERDWIYLLLETCMIIFCIYKLLPQKIK